MMKKFGTPCVLPLNINGYTTRSQVDANYHASNYFINGLCLISNKIKCIWWWLFLNFVS